MRRRVATDDPLAGDVRIFLKAANDTFRKCWFDAGFRSQAAARRAWPRCRHAVWGATRRMEIPRAARVFDGLTMRGREAALRGFSFLRFPLDDVKRELAADRHALAAFRKREPRASAELEDIFALLAADLGLLERQAEAMNESMTGPATGSIRRTSGPAARMAAPRR